MFLTNLRLATERGLSLNGRGCLQTASAYYRAAQKVEGKVGNHNTPNGAPFDVLGLMLLADWRKNVEHGWCAGNVNEQGSRSKIPPRANPATKLRRSVKG